MDIEDVKVRYFRGYCRVDGYKSTIDFYLDIEDDFYAEIEKVLIYLIGVNHRL